MSIANRNQQSRQLKLYDPEKGLKTIAVSEAGEKHWRRAKDATKLFEAVEAKIMAQADYVVWRDRVVVPSREKGKQKAPDGVSERKSQKDRLPAADPGNVVVHRWRKRLCSNGKVDDEKLKRATQIDADKIARVLDDARLQCVRICEQQKLGTIRGTEGTGEFERYTPAEYIEAARRVLGVIDLDPASCDEAQHVVRATRYFTARADGLKREWRGRVWLNPPYHRELAPIFIDKLLGEIAAGRVTAAVMLTNNSTDTEWFLTAAHACSAICFTNGRIKFAVPGGDEVLPTQGQAFFYFGETPEGFEAVFCLIGFCVRRSHEYESSGRASCMVE